MKKYNKNPLEGWGNTGLPEISEEEVRKINEGMNPDFAHFLNWFKNHKTKSSEEMYCFILYDIEHNKIRRILAKFLEKKGCIRVQKSVFFAKMHRKMYQEMKEIIIDLQKCYENQDTIIMLPVGEDMLNRVNCIGKNFEFELMTQTKNTLFF